MAVGACFVITLLALSHKSQRMAKQKSPIKRKQVDPVTNFVAPMPRVPLLKAPTMLSLNTILPDYIWAVPNFLSTDECNDFIRFFDTSSSQHVNIAQRGTRFLAHRSCVQWLADSPDLANEVYQRMCQSNEVVSMLHGFGTPVTCNPKMQMYKYEKGHKFNWHVDVSDPVGKEGYTRFTVLIYLSACRGGATLFEPPFGREAIAIHPVPGAMVLHLHGDDCLNHAGQEVVRGTKYVLRTDIVYKKDKRR